MARKNPSEVVAADVIFKSAYKCCVCQDGTKGDHIHHINGNEDGSFDNLAFLCFNHHNDATITDSLRRKLKPKAIIKFRDSWYQQVKAQRNKNLSGFDIEIKNLSEENLLKAALNANIIIELIKIKDEYFNADWQARKKILDKIGIYAEQTTPRITYEVYELILHVISQARRGMQSEIALSIFWLVTSYYIRFNNKEDQEQLDIINNQIIRMGKELIYEGAIYLNNLTIVSWGCNLLKIVYHNARHERISKDTAIHDRFIEKVLSTYEYFKNELTGRTESNFQNALEILAIFEEDLNSWGVSMPPFPNHLSKKMD